MRKSFFILINLLFLSSMVFGQSEKEDLVNLIKHFKGTKNDSLLVYSKKLQRSKDLINFKTVNKYKSPHQKKEYNIDEELESTILKGITDIKNLQIF